MKTLEPLLAEHRFLQGLKRPFVTLLAGCASNVRFAQNQQIFREGEKADHCYLIRHGGVAIEVFVPGRGPVVVETLEGGDVLGWSWLVPPHTWRFDARALELTRAVALDGQCLRGKCDENPELGYQLLRRLSEVFAQRLHATRLQLLDVYGVKGG